MSARGGEALMSLVTRVMVELHSCVPVCEGTCRLSIARVRAQLEDLA
jgi:hypothetical protein